VISFPEFEGAISSNEIAGRLCNILNPGHLPSHLSSRIVLVEDDQEPGVYEDGKRKVCRTDELAMCFKFQLKPIGCSPDITHLLSPCVLGDVTCLDLLLEFPESVRPCWT
jgi:hypothetical protein